MSPYLKLFLMVATSVVLMFGITYLESYDIIDHAFFSETRGYVALLMGTTMVVVMLAYMIGMFPNKGANIGIFFGAFLAFAAVLYLVRSQVTVDDVDYMEAMIPHHSIAILTSERAQISDPRVRKLADEIIKAQVLEIAEMKALIADLEGGPKATPEIDGK
ncbi:DUF305 domain-containing protein [Aurantimonas marina]|uniref:DUF305 domain-containing protein n=1 Tax=Aurantimonas marina TaxID=2780508 RepID=UPI0019D2CCA7|nr:DUF305 domain-containing protein [Aurantimonas marina]